MKVLVTSVLAILTVVVAPATSTAFACHECTYDDEGGRHICLLGCPVEEPDCIRIQDCQATEESCTGTAFCDPELEFAAVHASGNLQQPHASSQSPSFPFVLEDGSVIYRRQCDSVITARTYVESTVAEIKASTAKLSI